MEFPSLDLADLPSLDNAVGMFGSLSDLATAHTDDRIIILMVYLYELLPPDVLP